MQKKLISTGAASKRSELSLDEQRQLLKQITSDLQFHNQDDFYRVSINVNYPSFLFLFKRTSITKAEMP
jgi:hypothetical protein